MALVNLLAGISLFMATKRIIFFGDSLAFPKKKYGVNLFDTYPFKTSIKLNSQHFIASQPAATSLDVINQLHRAIDEFDYSDSFDVAVIQVGIVDCCPRSHSFLLERFLRKFSFLRPFINQLYKSKKPKKPWIDEDRFGRNIIDICKLSSLVAKKVILIPIMPGVNNLIKNIYNINDYVNAYNNILNEQIISSSLSNCSIIAMDTRENFEELLLPDGHHLTTKGHEVLSLNIVNEIQNE